MAAADGPGKRAPEGEAARHVYGPRPVSALLPALTRPAFKRRAPAATQVMTDWPAIVGPALAAVTSPQRLSAGTLTVACAGPVAMELQHLSGELIGRINAHLGTPVVQRLRFVQTLPGPPIAPAPIPAAATHAAEQAVAAMPPGPLRDALAALGAAVLSGKPPSTPPGRRG